MGTYVTALSPTIKSIQRGTIAITNGSVTNTATISAVDTSKSSTSFLGFTDIYPDVNNVLFPRIALTNATTVTATVAFPVSGSGNPTPSFEVVEYN